MAFSMLERPKLANAKSLKFYPEDYNQQISFRHKNLPPDFDLSTKHAFRDNERTSSVRPQLSHNEKCPIYVHNFEKIYKNPHFDGDFVKNKNKKHLLMKDKKSVLEKLEESYWANWKPNRSSNIVNLKSATPPERKKNLKNVSSPPVQVIKSAPTEKRRKKIKALPPQTEIVITEVKTQIESDVKEKKTQQIQTEIPVKPEDEEIEESNEDILADTKFLKHTDSLILHSKKQNEEKEHFEQPKCIRLYKKPGNKLTTKNYIKGGSYPLKSCLKKDSSFAKGNIRLGRPGSPIIVSSNFSSNNKHKYHYKR